jgi:hypothetical protein
MIELIDGIYRHSNEIDDTNIVLTEYYDVRSVNNKMNEDTKNFIGMSINYKSLIISGLELTEWLDLRTPDGYYDKIELLDCSNNYFTHIICSCSSEISKFIFEPNPIEVIKFPPKFNEPIDNLPNTVKKIIFSRHNSKFNCKIDDLPTSLEFLETGYSFNQPINSLPQSVTYLVLGKKFSQSLDNLPVRLKYICVDIFNLKNMNQTSLPMSVKLSFV